MSITTNISLIDAVKSLKGTSGNVIFIDLWSNQYRIPDVISVSKHQEKCKHIFDKNVCSVCGARKTIIGEESQWVDYINNLWLISSLLEGNEIFIFTRKELPVWINSALLPTLGNPLFRHHFANYYVTTEDKFLINFYPIEYPSKYKIEITNNRLFSFLNKCNIVINPTKKVLEISNLNGISKVFICNKQMERYTDRIRRHNGIFIK